jgi:hypothetical protein
MVEMGNVFDPHGIVDVRTGNDPNRVQEAIEDDAPVVERKGFAELVGEVQADLPAELKDKFAENLANDINASVISALGKTITGETDKERYIRELRGCWLEDKPMSFDSTKADLIDQRWEPGKWGLNWHVALNTGLLR